MTNDADREITQSELNPKSFRITNKAVEKLYNV